MSDATAGFNLRGNKAMKKTLDSEAQASNDSRNLVSDIFISVSVDYALRWHHSKINPLSQCYFSSFVSSSNKYL